MTHKSLAGGGSVGDTAKPDGVAWLKRSRLIEGRLQVPGRTNASVARRSTGRRSVVIRRSGSGSEEAPCKNREQDLQTFHISLPLMLARSIHSDRSSPGGNRRIGNADHETRALADCAIPY